MRIKILIRLKKQILEPQGKVIEQSLNNLGFEGLRNIRQGKLIELDLPENINQEEKDNIISSVVKRFSLLQVIKILQKILFI